MAHLFSPLDLGPVRLENRIVVSPMCQYSANDGCASDWHLQHLMQMGMSGAGLIMVEATGVERRGRITHGTGFGAGAFSSPVGGSRDDEIRDPAGTCRP
jgi:2,4-dienoyl-CoA reductase-like NADH-dependent reductase (Old Yellow Enzyme family)